MFWAKTPTATGIHLADGSVYVAELERVGSKVAVTGLGQAAVPVVCSPKEFGRAEFREELASILVLLGERCGFDYVRPTVSLHRQACYLKCCTPIPGSASFQRQHLHWEVEQVLPEDSAEFVIDYVLTLHTGIVVAVRKATLNLYDDLFDRAHIGGVDFDLSPFALFNLAEQTSLLEDDEAVLLVEVGESDANTILVLNGQIARIQQFSWEVNQGIAKQLRSFVVAVEQLLRDFPKAPSLWLAGTAVGEMTWSSELPQCLGMDSAILDPFKGIDIEGIDAQVGRDAHEFGVAIGLAMRRLFAAN